MPALAGGARPGFGPRAGTGPRAGASAVVIVGKGTVRAGAKEDGAEQVGVDAGQPVAGRHHVLAPGVPLPDDQHDAIHAGGQDGGVGHGVDGGGVEDDQVGLAGQPGDELLHAPRAHQVRRLRRQGSAWEQAQARDLGVLNGRVGHGRGVSQQGGQAGVVGQAEELVQAGLPQVAVDHQDLALGLRHGHGQVGQDGGLALGEPGGGDHERAQRLVEAGEGQVGAQVPVGLADRRVGIADCDQGLQVAWHDVLLGSVYSRQ
jgi:hypothetical protein